MKKFVIVLLAASSVMLISCFCSAQDDGDDAFPGDAPPNYSQDPAINVPPGMEVRQVGGTKMVVPQGTQVHQKGSLVIMEGPDEFVARNIKEIKDHLDAIDARQDSLQKEFDELKQTVAATYKK